jgi:hypothetical protein
MTTAASTERYYSSADGLQLFYRDFAPLSGPASVAAIDAFLAQTP